jgi:glycosyltransferase involved in cell wall biosynthesis
MNLLEQSESCEGLCQERIPRVTVVQIGSRRNYAVPIALAQAGALERLFTDWYAGKDLLTRTADWISRRVPSRILARAAARTVPEIPIEKVVHFPGFAVAYKFRKCWAARRRESPKAYIWGGQRFCEAVTEYGIPACDAIFCFSSVAKEIFESPAANNTLRILDQGIPPLAYDDRLVREQEAAHPEWAKPRPAQAGVEEYTERQREEWVNSDIILCPSKFCWQALATEKAPLEKVRILPFGITSRFFTGHLPRERNRHFTILFAANSPVRKGLPDLVQAIELLNSRDIRVIVAGDMSSLRAEAVSRTGRVAEILGCVTRPKMVELYRQADLFVFPTVSDIFPAVVLEAMAAGIPVITTPNCGSGEVIREGVDGFIVPIRSPEQLAEKIEYLVTHRNICVDMGRNAYERAKEYTVDRYRERLLSLLREELHRRHQT